MLTLHEVKIKHIAAVYVSTNGHLGEAARILGIHRNTLTRNMVEYFEEITAEIERIKATNAPPS